MSTLPDIPDVGDVVVVETLQTGVVISYDSDTDTVEWRHDQDGWVYTSPRRYVRPLAAGETRLTPHNHTENPGGQR